MKLVLIPPGTFMMGSPPMEVDRGNDEGPQHTVKISRPFYMGVYEVTQGEYEKVMGRNPSHFSKSGAGSRKVSGQDTSRFPVETVTWYDAIEFCNQLSEKDGKTAHYRLTDAQRDGSRSIKLASVSLLPGNGYRLPTEAEWEYACRGLTTTPFNFGSVLNGDQANINGNYPYGTTTKGENLERTTTVGSYAENKYGLFDMHGNVWEWCYDGYDNYSGVEVTDPASPSEGSVRACRGGSWYSFASNCRSAFRIKYSYSSYVGNDKLGFRVVSSEGISAAGKPSSPVTPSPATTKNPSPATRKNPGF